MLQGASEQVEARVIDYEEECDIAVLKIELESLPRPVAVGSSALLKVGQTVLASEALSSSHFKNFSFASSSPPSLDALCSPPSSLLPYTPYPNPPSLTQKLAFLSSNDITLARCHI